MVYLFTYYFLFNINLIIYILFTANYRYNL